MAEIKKSPEEIWAEYDKAVNYNVGIELYENVRKNEDFFIGDQWRGLNAPDLEKPVMNFIKRVITYFNAMIVSDDVGISISPTRPDSEMEVYCKILSREVERVIEKTGAKTLNREMLKNCAIDGDGDFYLHYDPDDGEIKIENVDNTKVLFGNPYVADIQKQRYILLVQRLSLESARELAEKEGADPDEIKADSDGGRFYGEELDPEQNLVTVLLKFWKQGGTVWYTKVTQDLVLKPPTDLGYRLYPVAHMMWERVKSSYHGRSPVTGLIPNQVFVNKLWAMAMHSVKNMAFPKVIYDSSKIPQWDNGVGRAIPITSGDPNQAIATSFRAADFSSQVFELVEKTISYTRDFMGASDAALGNVKPDNTSAIIAVQRASSAPLELQRMAFYQFVEDYVRIIIDIICTDYGLRPGVFTDETGEVRIEMLDYTMIDPASLELNVEIGSASYWSELSQVATLDNLMAHGIITDAETYLEAMPDHMIRNKQGLIDGLRRQREQAQQAAAQQAQQAAMGAGQNAMPTPPPTLPGIPPGGAALR